MFLENVFPQIDKSNENYYQSEYALVNFFQDLVIFHDELKEFIPNLEIEKELKIFVCERRQ